MMLEEKDEAATAAARRHEMSGRMLMLYQASVRRRV
jgi:hypothetical protein